MRRMILTSSLLLALSASAMASQVYKWVDEQGVTHFGSQPPQGQQATSVNTATAQPKPTTPPAPTFDSVADPKQAEYDEKVKKEVAHTEAELKRFCESIRSNLAQLTNNPRVEFEVNGEVRRMTEEERQKQISDAKKSISENCK